MLRTLVVIIYIVPATVVMATLVILSSLFSRTGNLPHFLARLWAKSVLFVANVRVTVRGLANIDPDRAYILMANHKGLFDIPVFMAVLPHQFRWLAKAELFRIPIFGYGMQRCGYISIDRANRRAAMESLRIAAEKIRNGVSVLIFPEGTRSADGRLQPFKKGGFVLAVKSGVPIVPMVISGTHQIMPKSKLRI